MSLAQKDRAVAGEAAQRHCLIAFDDLLWLLEFESPSRIAAQDLRIPRRVLDLFMATDLVERERVSLRLTEKGARALEQLT